MKNITKNIFQMMGFAALAAAQPAASLTAMSDDALSDVSGQDGITITMGGQTTADSVNWIPDAGTALESTLSLQGVTLSSVDMGGLNVGTTGLNVSAALDASSTGLAVDLNWDRMRMAVENVRHGTDLVNSLGSYVLDSSGTFRLANNVGLFNTAGDTASLYIALNDADMYYKQGTGNAPEMLLSNVDFLWDMPTGIVGIDQDGFLIEGDVNFNMTFDLRYDFAPTTPFTNDANDSHGLRFGWTGGITDAQLKFNAGGLWQASSTTGSAPNESYDQSAKTGGFHISSRWDYLPTFKWVVGETDGTRTSLEFGNWTKLPGPGYGWNFPYIAFDMINAGEGPGGLCWGADHSGPASSCTPKGGQYIDIAPEDNAFAFAIRDGQLRAYSTTVNLLDPGLTDTFNWALIYTWGDMDGNAYIYPGGDGSSTGLRMDIVGMNQTFDTEDIDGDGNVLEQGSDWNNGTHFMIGDTDANLAIGFVDSSFLLAANDMYVTLQPGPENGIEMKSDQVRLQMKGRFAGGNIPDFTERLEVTRVDLNLEMDDFRFSVFPRDETGTGGTMHVGYSAYMNFYNSGIANFAQNTAQDQSDDGTYISLAEPSRPDSDMRFADIRGTLEITKGKIDILSETETPIGRPAELIISNNLLIGQTATGGSPLVVNRVELGNDNLGKMVIPGGQWYAGLTLSPQY